ncbi:hypothetical protein ACJX0J_005493, partial [Zea mays]
RKKCHALNMLGESYLLSIGIYKAQLLSLLVQSLILKFAALHLGAIAARCLLAHFPELIQGICFLLRDGGQLPFNLAHNGSIVPKYAFMTIINISLIGGVMIASLHRWSIQGLNSCENIVAGAYGAILLALWLIKAPVDLCHFFEHYHIIQTLSSILFRIASSNVPIEDILGSMVGAIH